MSRFIFSLTLAICLIFTQVYGANAAPEQVGVKVTKDGATNKFNVKLTWDLSAGDSLWVSTNGQNWTNISITNPVSGSSVSVTDPEKRNSHSIIYYEIRNGSKRKGINVFPGTGDNYANQHGNYDKNTNTCVNCHTTHKAEGSMLLKERTVGALCDTCHSAATSGGVGSRYMTDIGGVEGTDGNYSQALGGLFGHQAGASQLSATINDVWKDYKVGTESLNNASSIHRTDSSDIVAPGDSSSGKRHMNCASCHQGHPSDSNYRLLKSTINGTSIGEIKAYAISDGTSKKDPQLGMDMVERPKYVAGLNEFCGQCHGVFNVSSGGATNNPKTIGGKAHYLHPVGEDLTYKPKNGATEITLSTTLPVSVNNQILCITCHFGHGTPVADKSTQASNYRENHQSTMLKRKANQTICQDCHKK